MAGVENERLVRGMGESTRRRFESHAWIGGRRIVEKANPTAKGWSFKWGFWHNSRWSRKSKG